MSTRFAHASNSLILAASTRWTTAVDSDPKRCPISWRSSSRAFSAAPFLSPFLSPLYDAFLVRLAEGFILELILLGGHLEGLSGCRAEGGLDQIIVHGEVRATGLCAGFQCPDCQLYRLLDWALAVGGAQSAACRVKAVSGEGRGGRGERSEQSGLGGSRGAWSRFALSLRHARARKLKR